jgi:hypothetical protein
MLDRVLSLIALAILIGFLSILVIWVPRADLTAVIVITLAVAFYDTVIHARRPPQA